MNNNNFFKKSILAAAVGISLTVASGVYAVQGGSIKGHISVVNSDVSLAGVTVTATSENMPKPRTAVTDENGAYKLPFLIPGVYELTFTSPKGHVQKQQVRVLLDKTANVNMVFEQSGKVDNPEVITVVGSLIVQEGDSSLTNSIGSDVVDAIPVGQEYRDLLKLIPGVQYSEDTVLGPSAGGSGRDNKYGFDGVDVSLPMFGNLASEPSTHDVESVSMDRGAAKAIGFNRSGGFAINTVSKSGTNEFHGSLEYKVQDKDWVADKDDADGTKYELDKNWITASLSGPIIEDELFFYTSFYRPEVTKENKETAYGSAKDYESTREEYYGKLTYAPIDDLLLNVSYRTSDREDRGESVGAFDTDSTSVGSDADQDIFTFDASYIINDSTTLEVQYSEFELDSVSRPDNLIPNVQPSLNSSLDLDNLDQLGLFIVPNLQEDNPDFDNDAAQVLINRYGYIDENGNPAGGGAIGVGSTIDEVTYTRDSFQLSLDHELEIGSAVHYLHFGYKWSEGEEELSRLSNGWGSISFVGGANVDNAGDIETPIYYRTTTQQMSISDETGNLVTPIVSKTRAQSFEINDTIEWDDFIFNVGVLISKDELFGQGLRANSDNVSGYELAPGNEYKMHTTNWADLIQPRLGVTWNYTPEDTVFANYAKYHPEASSLARAASWARNTRKTVNVFFDEQGDYIGNEPASGSSGKFFQDGIKPRQINEFTIGTTKAVSQELFLRAHARYRKGEHFWEDTWNGSRLYGEYQSPFGGVPEHIAEKGLYIPNLDEMRDEVGGSSYVIAELDESYTKYYELNFEATYQTARTYLNASYVWSNYYGNFDQDNVSGSNDANLFIGSSNLADGKGRQLWDGKNGKLSGNKPHVFKAFGYYELDWGSRVGAYFLFQEGDVWEAWDGQAYGYSSSTIRYAEHAGSRRETSHWQLDLNYTHEFNVFSDQVVTVRADLFNLFDNQTGYNYDPYVSSDTFGKPRDLYSPRRLQLSAKLQF